MKPLFEDVDAEPPMEDEIQPYRTSVDQITNNKNIPTDIQSMQNEQLSPLQALQQRQLLAENNLMQQNNLLPQNPEQFRQYSLPSMLQTLKSPSDEMIGKSTNQHSQQSNDKYVQNYFNTMTSYLNGEQKGYTLNPQMKSSLNHKGDHSVPPETITEIKTASEAALKQNSDQLFKRVEVNNETVVEVIGDDNTSNSPNSDPDLLSLSDDSRNHTLNETEEFKNLLEEARKTKEQIEKLSAKLDDDSDDSVSSLPNKEVNETSTSKKSSLDSLQNDISVERGVRQLLVKHLIQVQIEDRRREEALESILKHYDITAKELKGWDISQGAYKAIMKAKIKTLDPLEKLKLAKEISKMKEVESESE